MGKVARPRMAAGARRIDRRGGRTLNAQSADQADDVAVEIISALPDSFICAFAQIALFKDWAMNGVPDRAEDALGQFHEGIEAAPGKP